MAADWLDYLPRHRSISASTRIAPIQPKSIGFIPDFLIRPDNHSSINMPRDYDPTEGMSPLQLFLAGVGQGMNNTALGVRQALGNASRDDVREARSIDSALLGRGLGAAGSVLGSTASMVPAAFVPGANTLVGAGLVGGGLGLLQPSDGPDEAMRNALGFGLLGPASIAAGRGLSGLLATQPNILQAIK